MVEKKDNSYWFNYIKCDKCGHIERRFALIPYIKCDKCGAKK